MNHTLMPGSKSSRAKKVLAKRGQPKANSKRRKMRTRSMDKVVTRKKKMTSRS